MYIYHLKEQNSLQSKFSAPFFVKLYEASFQRRFQVKYFVQYTDTCILILSIKINVDVFQRTNEAWL